MVFNLERLLDHSEVVGDEEYGKSLWSWSQETPLKAPVHSCFTAAKHVALVKVLISLFPVVSTFKRSFMHCDCKLFRHQKLCHYWRLLGI